MAEVLRGNHPYDLERLTEEAKVARNLLEFSKGPYGNGVSLPSAEQMDERFRQHRNNVPFSGALERCPYMRHRFDSFKAPKAAFRLLRRGPKAAYSFHDVKDKGRGVIRLQIPFRTSDLAFLLIVNGNLDLKRFDYDHTSFKGDANGDVWFDLPKLRLACDGAVELFYLQAGFVHYFDTNQVHTLINAADEERITLSIDLVENEWVTEWMRTNVTQRVAPSPIGISADVTWKWNSLRHGILRTA